MFTGLVEEIGLVETVFQGGICISAKTVLKDSCLGDSIAVNGVCLTIAKMGPDFFTADVMPETFQRSNLGSLKKGDKVNLERAMRAEGRFGGHMVSGHIDGRGKIVQVKKEENAFLYTIICEKKITDSFVEKGSVAVDGTSLTLVWIKEGEFCISLIPHTVKNTVLGHKKEGDSINIEADMIGKYVYHFLQRKEEKKGIDRAFLERYGF